jgi:hypothetical protein
VSVDGEHTAVSVDDTNAVIGADAVCADDETIGEPRFEAPSVEEATFILRTLTWGEHYIATEMNSASGNRQIYLYSLEEAARFFNSEVASNKERRSKICWVDRDTFITWIAEVVGDTELADALTEALANQITGSDRTMTMHALINLRVEQLRSIVNP